MEGCPYCDMMKPEWDEFKKRDVIDTIDVDRVMLNSMIEKDPNLFKPVYSFPTIYSNVEPEKEYENVRTSDGFINFSNEMLKKAKKVKETPKKETKKKTKETTKKTKDTKKTKETIKKTKDTKKTKDKK